MPEKPPSIPPPSDPEIIFVGPEEDQEDQEDLGWTAETLAQADGLRKKLQALSPKDPDAEAPFLLWPAFFKSKGMAKDTAESAILLDQLIEAESDLVKGKKPRSLRPELMIRIYREAIEAMEKFIREF